MGQFRLFLVEMGRVVGFIMCVFASLSASNVSTRGAAFRVAFADMLMVLKCADITFSSTAPLGPCMNGTGVTSTGYSGPYTNANETGGENGTSSPVGSVPAAPQSKGAARKTELGVVGLIMGGIMTTLLW